MKVRPPQQVLEEKENINEKLKDKTEDETDENTLEEPTKGNFEESYKESVDQHEPADKSENLNKIEDIKKETMKFEESINISDESVVHEENPTYTHQDEDSKITIYTDKPVFKKNNTIIVKSKFPKSATSVDCIITATGYKDKVIASGKELRLLQHRLYLIPVNTYEDSDEYSNIKVMSDMSDKIDVRYVKDGFACVTPLSHNVKIYDDIRLAVLS